jgi:hypothetical protein
MNNLTVNEILEGIEAFRSKHPSLTRTSPPSDSSVQQVVSALGEFMECVRYLNTRRSGTALTLDSEAAVQDALYLMLRPWIRDLVPENPTDRIANRYSIKDFTSRSLKIVIEAKYVRDKDHGKSITKEINDDIETYRYHPHCEHLIFFIYDPDANLSDAGAVISHVFQERTYSGTALRCYCIIKP